MVIANKLFWALGYNQVETFLTTIDPRRVEIDPKATVRRPNGKRTPFTQSDLDAVLERAARNADGTYRSGRGRQLPGKILGPFRYEGTRSDDPNDIVPHEERRELRALRVFGAWTNLTDLKAGNTLDTTGHRERQVGGEALPPGRWLNLRHGCERTARLGRRVGVLLPGRHDPQAPVDVRLWR